MHLSHLNRVRWPNPTTYTSALRSSLIYKHICWMHKVRYWVYISLVTASMMAVLFFLQSIFSSSLVEIRPRFERVVMLKADDGFICIPLHSAFRGSPWRTTFASRMYPIHRAASPTLRRVTIRAIQPENWYARGDDTGIHHSTLSFNACWRGTFFFSRGEVVKSGSSLMSGLGRRRSNTFHVCGADATADMTWHDRCDANFNYKKCLTGFPGAIWLKGGMYAPEIQVAPETVPRSWDWLRKASEVKIEEVQFPLRKKAVMYSRWKLVGGGFILLPGHQGIQHLEHLDLFGF
jgi:hypothetical protein